MTKVLITGGGIGGISTALSLIKHGFEVEVYEQASELMEIGAGIQLSANAMHVLLAHGLEPQLSKLWVKPSAYVFRLHDTGEIISKIPLAEAHERQHGAPYCQFHRADLLDALVARLREIEPDVIRLNSRAIGYEETNTGVRLRLQNGATVPGDVLVGADGVKSTIRAQLLGAAKPTYTGDSAWRLTVPSGRLKLHSEREMAVWMGPDKHIVSYFLRGGELINFVGLVETTEISEESWVSKFPWEKLKQEFVGWNEEIQSIINAADRDECYRWSLFFRPPVENWSSPRVTLLGDAVHATLPYLAQGACMAIEDGAVLARCLVMEPDVSSALRLYQRNRIDRTAKIVNGSTANRDLYHDPDQNRIRAYFRQRDEAASRNNEIYAYNPLTVPLN
jgi:salicylate hydroxylase